MTEYVAAFNRGDIEAMLTRVNEDIIWWMLIEDEFVAETRGKEALRLAMAEFLSGGNHIQSHLLNLQTQGQTVSVIERVSMTAALRL